jgi:2,5-diketo-D-gluconate reductase A
MSDIPTIRLHNGVDMPQVGLGVWQAADGSQVEQAMAVAFEAGYRLIDTAAIYGNEQGVGRAIRASGLKREEIFITTKLWNSEQGYDRTLKAFDESLSKLGLDTVDLYLIHWPMPKMGKYVDTWRAMEKLYADKRVRAIGVSNFKPAHLDELLADASVVPMVNQIELHPRLQQGPTRAMCDAHDIRVEAYSPLMHGGDVLDDPAVTSLAAKYDKTPAQVILRWHVQHEFIVIPKSVTPDRIVENIELFDFAMTDADMATIDALDTGKRVGADPDQFN